MHIISISFRETFFQKHIFPIVMLGILDCVAIYFVFSIPINAPQTPIFVSFITWTLAIVFLYFSTKSFNSDLVDEVWDDGQALVIKKNGEEDRVLFEDIINVSYRNRRPPRAILSLKQPCHFGQRIAFCPKSTFNFRIWENLVVNDLIERVDTQRREDKNPA